MTGETGNAMTKPEEALLRKPRFEALHVFVEARFYLVSGVRFHVAAAGYYGHCEGQSFGDRHGLRAGQRP